MFRMLNQETALSCTTGHMLGVASSRKNGYLRPLLPWALGHLQLWVGARGAETVKAKHTPVRNGIATDTSDYVTLTDLAWLMMWGFMSSDVGLTY